MKATKAQIYQRIQQVLQLMLNGSSRSIIVQYCSENWNVGERQADKYILKANSLCKKSIVKDAQLDYAKAMRRFEFLYSRCLERNDYRAALAVNKEIAALQGLYQERVKHSGTVEFISSIPE